MTESCVVGSDCQSRQREAREMTFTARDIVEALQGEGFLSAAYVDTGGGVMNVAFTPICQHDVELGEILASDNGDWGYGDYDTPSESVGVMAYSPDGDPMSDEPSMCTNARGAVVLFDALSYGLERFCPQCFADHGKGE